MDAVGGEINAFTAQGVHLLLRAGARPRPAAGRRRRVRHGHLLGGPVGRRRGRAQRGARGDRDARRRPVGHRARLLRRGRPRRRARWAAPCSARWRRSRGSAAARCTGYYRRRYRPAAMVVACRRQPRPRHRGARWSGTRSPGMLDAEDDSAPPLAVRAPARRTTSARGGVRLTRRPTEQANVVLGTLGHRPRRRAPVRPGRAEQRPRRRHELPAVPGGPGEPRPGLQRLLLLLAVLRHRPVRRLRRLPAVQGRRGARHLPRAARRGRRARASPPPSSPAARASWPAGWCSAWRTPARG